MRRRSWLTGLVLLCTLVGGAWPAARQSAETTNGTWTADVETSWRGDDGRPRVQLQLRTEGRDSHWGFGVRPEDLQGLPPGARDGAVANARFHLVREAGTFTFSGTFDDGRGMMNTSTSIASGSAARCQPAAPGVVGSRVTV